MKMDTRIMLDPDRLAFAVFSVLFDVLVLGVMLGAAALASWIFS